MLLSAGRDQAAKNVKMLGGAGVLVGLEMSNKCGFLTTEVHAEKRVLQFSGCRSVGR